MPKEPTIKQRKAAEIMAENGGIASRAMIEAGYSPQTAKRPDKLTRSKGFQDLIKKYIPERHALERHREMLDAPRIVRVTKRGELEVETEETDPSAVKALDMFYKIGGKYPKESSEVGNKILIINVTPEGAEKYGIKAKPGTVGNL